MEASFPTYNQADYRNWADSQNNDPGARSEDVLNPIRHEFKEAKMCGTGGKTHVNMGLYLGSI